MAEDQKWKPTTNAKYGIVVWNFERGSYPFLSLKLGEAVQILEESCGWYRGFSVQNKQRKGIFPASHVHLKPCNVSNPGPKEVVVPKEESIARETASALQEWRANMEELFESGEKQKFNDLRKHMYDLIEWRRQVLTQSLTRDKMKDLKGNITTKTDSVNKDLKLDVIPREATGEIINPTDVSIVHLYKRLKHQEERRSAVRDTIAGLTQSSKPSTAMFNIWFKLELLMMPLRHSVEAIFTIYDKRSGRNITEPYQEILTERGLPSDLDKIGCTFAMFTELDQSDRNNKELFLLCRLLKITNEMDHKKTCTLVRLPLGVAVYPLSDLLSGLYDDLEDGKSTLMQVYMSNQQFSADFAKLQDYVISGDRQNCVPSQDRGVGLIGLVKVIEGPLEKAREDNPLFIRKNTAICRKLGFSEASRSGESRHDIFIELHSGYFWKGSKKADKNIEMQVSVVNENGKPVEGLVSCGQGSAPSSVYKTAIFYHCAQCSFIDTVRVNVPPDLMEKYCVRFRIGHLKAGGQPKFDCHAVAFMRLVSDSGAAIADGFHDLNLFSAKEAMANSGSRYLREPWEATDSKVPSIPVVPKDSFKVHTIICSTSLPQNTDLLRLLRWHKHREQLVEVLRAVKRIPGEAILKFPKDTLDATFDVVEQSTGKEGDLAFQALVYVLSTVLERRFTQHRGVLDQYMEKSFQRPQVYQHLMDKLKAAFKEVMQPQQKRQLGDDTLVKTMKAAEYLVKFIVRSRKQYDEQTRGRNKEVFNRDLRDTLVTFFEMIKFNFHKDDAVAPRSQALALQFFPATLGDFLSIVSRQLLSETIADFLMKLNPTRLPGFKTTFLQALVSSELFRARESRLILLPAVLRQLKVHILGADDQFRFSLEVLQDILAIIYKQDPESASEEVHTLVSQILQSLYTVYKQIKLEVDQQQATGQKTHFRLTSAAVSLLGILQLMKEKHFRWCITTPEESPTSPAVTVKSFENFIHQSFFVFFDMVDRTLFPSDWSVLFLLMNSILLLSTQLIMKLISADMLGSRDGQGSVSFSHSLWRNFFQFAASYCTQESLQVETFTVEKCSRILEWCGDMRVVMNDLMVTYWKQLGMLRVRFVPEMVGSFLQVSLLPQKALRQRTIPLFYDMMVLLSHGKDGFRLLELEMIDKLDTHITQGRGDVGFKEDLSRMLEHECRKDMEMVKCGGLEFIYTLTKLLDRLFDFRSVASGGEEEGRDLKMHVMCNLLNFYKDLGRDEMYIRYIYRLTDMHKSRGSYAEAAYTLLLHGQLLQYSSDRMTPEGPYPAQTCAERKEALYRDIISLFDKGKLWECGVEQCKDLIQHHQYTFNYQRLAELHMTISQFYNKILTELRADPQYFRVSFFGGFPPFFKDRIFVFRGLEYEKLTSFQERLSTMFPNAQYMKSLEPPTAETRKSTQQYLQCCVVTPVSEKSQFEEKRISEQILQFYSCNNVKMFSMKRPFHKGIKDKENEFASLWLEVTTYTTVEAFPGIMRWFEVATTLVEELSPLENAIEFVKDGIAALKSQIRRLKNDETTSSNQLTMKLQGILDAAVSGGLKNYEVFFTDKYRDQYHYLHFSKLTAELKEQMAALVQVCAEALKLHGKVCTAAMRGLHEFMEQKYREFRKKYGNVDDEDPYEPLRPKGSEPAPPATPFAASTPSSQRSFPAPGSRPTSVCEDTAVIALSPDAASEVPPPVPTKQRPPRARAQTLTVVPAGRPASFPTLTQSQSDASPHGTPRRTTVIEGDGLKANGLMLPSNSKVAENIDPIAEDDTDL